jgi:hypothetical protein
MRLPPYSLSRGAPSATRPPLQKNVMITIEKALFKKFKKIYMICDIVEAK